MQTPEVSVIMPVYNSAAYLEQAIDSVLKQTFTNFELIIIDDGSTDSSNDIIQSFSDSRVIYLKNDKNNGLIYTLNKGIDTAKGKYIARMDGDDICVINRLETQKERLDKDQDISVIASTVQFINEEGVVSGDWKLDRQTTTPSRIRSTMPFENCIAHPSVMIRSGVLKELKYKSYQKNIEDYDLWLRILSKGHQITKTEDPLLFYRKHNQSITTTYLNQTNFFYKHARLKRKFIWNEIKQYHLNIFIARVLYAMLWDEIRGIAKDIKTWFK